MHFFSPVPVMPLVELIRGAATDDATEAAIRALAGELGKQVIVSADRPGFLVNRILMPLLGEAMRAFEEGVGTAEDIDTGAKVGLNHPMGPLELADFIGLDVCLGIMRVLHDGLGGEQFRPPRCSRSSSPPATSGQKTGRGFYTLPALSPGPRAARTQAANGIRAHPGAGPGRESGRRPGPRERAPTQAESGADPGRERDPGAPRAPTRAERAGADPGRERAPTQAANGVAWFACRTNGRASQPRPSRSSDGSWLLLGLVRLAYQ